MEVVSHGQYHTMSDCAVGDGESLYIGSGIYIDVTKMTADELEFEISGITQTTPRMDCVIENELLSVKLKSSTFGGVILVSEFDNNNVLLRLTTYSPQSEIKVPLHSDTCTAKVMWWDSFVRISPVADAKNVAKQKHAP